MQALTDFYTFLTKPEIAIHVCYLTVIVLLLFKRPYTAIYVGLMPLINWAFAGIPTIPIAENLGGGNFHPFTIVTGLVLVARDFAQREIKHWVLGAMLLGLALSSLTAWPVIVLASGVAFLISETADWAVYTFTKKPLSQRIIISSLISAPLDQIAFIYLASLVVDGIFAWGTIVTGIVSKLVGAYVVSRIVAAHERRTAAQQPAQAALTDA
jgi:uncharacterized PurR-regulated membrane protein YhhQ (DUF165 family)